MIIIESIIIIAIVGALQAMAVAFISGLFARDAKNRKAEQTKMEKRAKLRAEGNLLSMKLMSATVKLSIAIANAMKQSNSTNEDINNAIADVKKTHHAYLNFIGQIASDQISLEE